MRDDREGPPNGGAWLPERWEGGESPEQQELQRKRDEIARLRAEVVEREMKLSTLTARVEGFAFGRLYRLGSLYARIDELALEIAQLHLALDPGNAVLERRVQEAEARARRSREAALHAEECGPPQTVYLTREVKEAYRAAARRMHPDLGRTPEERELRHKYMVRLNAAYQAGDLGAILDVAAAWELDAEPPEALSVADDLVRVIRAMARLEKSLRRLNDQIDGIRAGPEHALMMREQRSEAEGVDLLKETEAKLRTRIESLETELRDLRGTGDA